MRKFRIVQVIDNASSSDRKSNWIIEEKKWWGWSEVEIVEGPKTVSVEFKSYEDAEKHLLDNYTGWGVCRRYGNVYEYKSYTMLY